MKPIKERLEERTVDQGECRVWIGQTKDGYGRMKVKGRWRRVHRLTWEEERGPIPEGLGVLHTCDNRPCRNLNHLFLGDSLANNRDRHAKGRSRFGRGERHGHATLTWKEVDEIRAKLARGERGDHLAFEYGVTAPTITKIKLFRIWKPEHRPA